MNHMEPSKNGFLFQKRFILPKRAQKSENGNQLGSI